MIHDYDEAIAYLERLVATPVRNEPGAGLERARLMLAHVGDPQNRFVTLHVTGSSGKGSTSALAAAMLRAAGYRTGVFTSPHLESYTERIAVDGQSITGAEWTRLLNHLRPFVERMASGDLPDYTLGRPALLQVLWPMAALYFAERGVDVAVVEVGMGGRYDSTNANSARVAVVTNVTLEHTRYLGATVAAIAEHKAGVAKPGGILVTAAQDPDALAVIAAECARQGTTLWRVTPRDSGEVTYSGESDDLRIVTPAATRDHLRLGLLGRHQHANAACAVAAVDALCLRHRGADVAAAPLPGVAGDGRDARAPRTEAEDGQNADGPRTEAEDGQNADGPRAEAEAEDWQDAGGPRTAASETTGDRLEAGGPRGTTGGPVGAHGLCYQGAPSTARRLDSTGLALIAVSDEAIRAALEMTRVPGRLERVADDPPTILDGAHNPDAARILAAALRDLFPGQRFVLLLGILGDKDIEAMVDALAPLAAAMVVTEPPWEGRMGRGDDVARAAERHVGDVALIPDVPEALAAAQQRARDLRATLIVAGSLILVGAVRSLLR